MNNHSTCGDYEHLLYLTTDEMDRKEQLFLSGHLLTCGKCRDIHETFLNTRRAIILTGPVADIPQFEIQAGFSPTYAVRTRILRIATLVSGIAAILLIGLFIWEQSVSVYKISRLENRMQSVVASTLPGMIDKMTVEAAFRDQEWKEFWGLRDLNHSLADPGEKIKIRSMIEKRMLNPDKSGAGQRGFFRNALLANQYALTYKKLIR